MSHLFLSPIRQMAKKMFSQIFSGNHDSFIEHHISSIEQPDFFTTFYRRRISPNNQIEQNDRIKLEASRYPNLESEPMVFPKLGIVIQGPVCVESDFTSRVISRYLEIYPNALIIFSTWVGEEVKLKNIDELKLSSKFRIVLNEKPQNPGLSNINLQIESTKNGLKLAKELNCEFAIKTRSDQAFLNVNSISLLHFELAQAENNYNKNKRIVAVSLDTFLFRPYGVSDMFHFGRIETLLDFWETDLDFRNPESSSALNSTTLRDYSKLELAECQLIIKYLLKKNFEPNFSLRQSLEFIRDCFVIVDQQAIDLVWNKNTRKEFRYRSDVYPSKFQEIQNWEWRAMQSDLDNFLKLEFLLDYPNEF